MHKGRIHHIARDKVNTQIWARVGIQIRHQAGIQIALQVSDLVANQIFEQVRDALPKVSLGTVYRNLGVLKEEGLVREIYGNDRRAHYDADTSPHAHFMCSSCDQIIDVRGVQPIDWRPLKDLVGCSVGEQNVVFGGLCAHCRQQDAKEA